MIWLFTVQVFLVMHSPNPNYSVSYHHNAASWEWETKTKSQKIEVYFDKIGILPLYRKYKAFKKIIKKLIVKQQNELLQ